MTIFKEETAKTGDSDGESTPECERAQHKAAPDDALVSASQSVLLSVADVTAMEDDSTNLERFPGWQSHGLVLLDVDG